MTAGPFASSTLAAAGSRCTATRTGTDDRSNQCYTLMLYGNPLKDCRYDPDWGTYSHDARYHEHAPPAVSSHAGLVATMAVPSRLYSSASGGCPMRTARGPRSTCLERLCPRRPCITPSGAFSVDLALASVRDDRGLHAQHGCGGSEVGEGGWKGLLDEDSIALACRSCSRCTSRTCTWTTTCPSRCRWRPSTGASTACRWTSQRTRSSGRSRGASSTRSKTALSIYSGNSCATIVPSLRMTAAPWATPSLCGSSRRAGRARSTPPCARGRPGPPHCRHQVGQQLPEPEGHSVRGRRRRARRLDRAGRLPRLGANEPGVRAQAPDGVRAGGPGSGGAHRRPDRRAGTVQSLRGDTCAVSPLANSIFNAQHAPRRVVWPRTRFPGRLRRDAVWHARRSRPSRRRRTVKRARAARVWCAATRRSSAWSATRRRHCSFLLAEPPSTASSACDAVLDGRLDAGKTEPSTHASRARVDCTSMACDRSGCCDDVLPPSAPPPPPSPSLPEPSPPPPGPSPSLRLGHRARRRRHRARRRPPPRRRPRPRRRLRRPPPRYPHRHCRHRVAEPTRLRATRSRPSPTCHPRRRSSW